MIGKTIDELKVGDTAEFTKTVSEADIYLYAGVTGDNNPAHIDEVYAQKTEFLFHIDGPISRELITQDCGNKTCQ